MHPAPSIILFTTLSGAGFGLVALLALGYAPVSGVAGWVGFLLAFAMTGIGLVSSTFHLGHPERAWRALSQWRSSWLSREGVLALLTLPLFALYGIAALFFEATPLWLGLLVAALSAATVFATAMIYACLKTVARWYSPVTPVCYLLFGLAGGLLLAVCLRAGAGEATALDIAFVIGTLAAAWLAKWRWWMGVDTAAPVSTPETATGLGRFGAVRQLDPPHTSANYLMKEMVFRIGRKHAEKVRRLAIGAGAFVPFALLVLALPFLGTPALASLLLGLAAIVHIAGMLCERWLFFAEAKHTVSLYYGR